MATVLERDDSMFASAIKLLHGDRPLESDRRIYDAAISIRDEKPVLTRFEEYEVDTLLACAIHVADNLPALCEEAWSRVQSPWSLRHSPAKGVEPTVDALCARIDERLASFRAARVASEDGTAARRLREMMDEQALLHPRLGLSFGYIGNCDFGGRHDDRSWMIFAKLATPRCTGACDVHFGGHATAQLGKLMQLAEEGLAAWCDKQEQRLDAGEIRVVGA